MVLIVNPGYYVKRASGLIAKDGDKWTDQETDATDADDIGNGDKARMQ